eukprot:364937-Chlamydomonas_euryale.AAC.6
MLWRSRMSCERGGGDLLPSDALMWTANWHGPWTRMPASVASSRWPPDQATAFDFDACFHAALSVSTSAFSLFIFAASSGVRARRDEHLADLFAAVPGRIVEHRVALGVLHADVSAAGHKQRDDVFAIEADGDAKRRHAFVVLCVDVSAFVQVARRGLSVALHGVCGGGG